MNATRNEALVKVISILETWPTAVRVSPLSSESGDLLALREAWTALAAVAGVGSVREIATSDADEATYLFEDEAGGPATAVTDVAALDDLGERAERLRSIAMVVK